MADGINYLTADTAAKITALGKDKGNLKNARNKFPTQCPSARKPAFIRLTVGNNSAHIFIRVLDQGAIIASRKL